MGKETSQENPKQALPQVQQWKQLEQVARGGSNWTVLPEISQSGCELLARVLGVRVGMVGCWPALEGRHTAQTIRDIFSRHGHPQSSLANIGTFPTSSKPCDK